MQWIITVVGLLILFALAWGTRRKSAAAYRNAPLENELMPYLSRLASGARATGYGKARRVRGALRELQASIGFMNALNEDELLPASKWLCDNGRFLQEETVSLNADIRALPKLPKIKDGELRAALFARTLIMHSNAVISAPKLKEAADAWQKSSGFTVDELQALPALIRAGLINVIIEMCGLCANEQRAQLAAERFLGALKRGRDKRAMRLFKRWEHSGAFLERLLSDLRKGDEGKRALWLTRYFADKALSAEALAASEHEHQAESCVWVSGAITSLRTVARLPWHRLLDEMSQADGALRADETYRLMDRESRAYYRGQAATISRETGKPELSVCCAALELAGSAEGVKGHVGYYLIDDGLDALYKYLQATGLRLRLKRFIARHVCGLTRIICWLVFAALAALAAWARLFPAIWLPFAIVGLYSLEQLALYVFAARSRPRLVPRLRLERFAEDTRTLVVCPTMLLDAKQALHMVKQLSILYHANPDENLHFMLLGDFRDSITGTLSDDDEIVRTASAAVRALSEDTGRTFYYMQRERVSSPRDHIYMSRERKRGGLETLMKLLAGKPVEDSFAYSSVPPEALKGAYRYVITLDSDTFMPPGAALRLAGAMLHPLNRRQTTDGRMRGYSVIQPRMEVAAHKVDSRLARLMGGRGGADPYNALVADFCWDACARGSFVGKGIIDPYAFLEATEGKIPSGTVLSHDLLEGELAGCALSSDITLFDGHPRTLSGFCYRLNRWTRGDWQLLPYLLNVFVEPHRPPKKALDSAARRKLRQNLLISLVKPIRLILIGYAVGTGIGWLFWAALLLPELAALIKPDRLTLPALICRLAALPAEAVMQADAIGRTLYRLTVSHQGMLKWTTAAQLQRVTAKPPMLFFYISMITGGALAALALLPGAAMVAGLFAAAFFCSFPAWLPTLEQDFERPQRPTEYMREVLTRLAENTLLFFDASMTDADNSLPPDNVQLEPNKGISHRTSPTNIGLYLLSLIAFERLRLISPDDMASRMSRTVATLERLARWQGHYYNWYDTRTLEPLKPAYISTVDSGNLAACLMTCAQGVRVLMPELTSGYRELPARLDELASAMRFDLLFDPDAELFYIGRDPEREPDGGAHYDLLASESRLTSYIAIMTGQAPVRHWYRLGRTRTRLKRGQTLVSFSGTMFEYMLPLVLQPALRDTLIFDACRAAFREQRRHRLGGAFGISESGYYAFDPNLYYQYKAFGVPALALDSTRDMDVIAPYATPLAMAVDLKRAFLNIVKLQALGLQGPMGMFEAADFDKVRIGDRRQFRVVRSHMAHHQGMIAASICNALCEGYLTELFIALPRAQAYRLLLEEKPQRGRVALRRPLKRRHIEQSISPFYFSRPAEPLVFPIDGHLLHGAGTTMLVDAQGGGYISRDGVMLTRFHEGCRIPSGARYYMRDSESGACWSLTDPWLVSAASFETAQASFTHRKYQMETTLRVFVNPLDGAAINHITIKNEQKTERMLEICSYLEPSLAPRRDDEAHPIFQNLFIETERLSQYGVLARCRPRKPDDKPRELWHSLSTDASLTMLRVQTDRAAFIGRGRTVYAPRALELPISATADSLGAMIEPCVSLRAQFVLPAGGRVQLVFATLMPSAQDTPAAFGERYATPDSALRCYEPALTQGLVTSRYLGLSPQEQAIASRLCGALCYAGQPAQSKHAADNALPIRELWSLGISGDLPIWTIVCESENGLQTVKLMLKARAWYHMSGLWTDMVIICEKQPGSALMGELQELVRQGCPAELLGKDGGVRLLARESLADGRSALLLAASRLTLTADGQDIGEQMKRLEQSVKQNTLYAVKPSSGWKLALPAIDALLFDNGIGGFTEEEGNYVVTLPPGRQTPAPWCNPLCSEAFGTLAGESGLIFTYAGNSNLSRLTRFPNDSVTPGGEEEFYIKDVENKLLWSPTRLPLGIGLPVRATHAAGETVYEASGYGIYSRLTCFTDVDAPFGVRVTHLKNEDGVDRLITLYHVCQFSIGAPSSGWQLARVSRDDGAMLVESPQLKGACCLCAVDPPPTALAAMSAGAFQGLWGVSPFALACAESVSGEAGNVAVLSFTLQLPPGESRTIVTALGYGKTTDELRRAIGTLRADGASLRLHRAKQSWERQLGAMRFDLPDKALSLMLNRWLPYQVLAARLCMRAGFYQAGGAIGFRDQLQDMLSQTLNAPDIAREHLLNCAAHQFEEGDVQHWWHPPRYGVRTRISDDLLFLPYVTAAYVQATGDTGALYEQASYLSDEPLREGERERLSEPSISPVSEPLWQHCLRAIDHVRLGAHGLPLMGGGDWNDGMSEVGGENGESVWLGMFMAETLRRFAPLCEPVTARRLIDKRAALMRSLERYAWDGAWYLRAWYDDGEKLGSAGSAECRIDLLPQCWAVLCGLSRERAAVAMDAAWRMLYEHDIGIIKLFTPPFNGAEKPGYIAGYLPGVRENGGQYTHAAAWAVSALHQLGEDERAWELALQMLPINHALSKQQCLRYRVEPYALAADIYSNPQQRGRGGWTWYTGSAGWLWTVVVEELFGFQKIGNTLRLRPVAPKGWDALHISYRYGASTYHLHASRDCAFPVADGALLTGGRLLLVDDGRIHEATFPLR